jgi:acyl-[acyl-carrier-protein]-phospholipid O-acyltransferase/long-chain-fatty-acid--[acyl-carrier-protein] ligase
MIKILLRILLRLLYRFQTCNESILKTPGPVLLLPNHVSWWDWALLGVCLEDDWRFVTSSTTAQFSWLHRRVMINRRTFPVDMNSPYAVKHIAEYLQHGGRLVLFPEGRLSATGSLMKLFDGTGFLILKTHAKVITAYIRGASRLPFSPNPNRKRWLPRVSVHFSDILEPPRTTAASVTAARHDLTHWLRDQMLRQQFETEFHFGPATLPEAILQAARRQPGKVVLEDVTLSTLSYRRLLAGARALAAQWRELLPAEPEYVGVLLPNVNAMPVVLLSLWAANRIPAILNYTTGPAILQSCARLARLKHVITSRTFLERSGLDTSALTAAGVSLVFLEDVRTRISPAQKLLALAGQFPRPRFASPRRHRPEDTAVVLFTSGSEGDPKGVELSHRNLMANLCQVVTVVDLLDADRIFNALPLFHSFGLAIGLFLPLVRGLFSCLYLSPLHYRIVPSAFYNLNCTIMFATNTFLLGYARKAHPYDFRSLRYLFAGSEKLQESTSALWAREFGVRVLEGYGATECSPVVSVNLPTRARQGSAGQLLPGIQCRIEPVEGILPPAAEGHPHAPQAGRLLVRGPNIMRGYLNPEANASFQALGGWYDTGDIAMVDGEGFLHLLGRHKRFAKISGEMISLTAIEECLASAFPHYGLKFSIAIVARPDALKGERLVAFTSEPRLTLEEIRETLKSRGFTNLAAPRELHLLHELPRLGSGKVNHRELARLAQSA